MASTLPLHRSNPALLSGLHRPPLKSHFATPLRVRRIPSFSLKSPISASSSSSSSPSSWEREEARWLREEQRWIREEKRWLREESRWVSERETLLAEIAALRLRIEALERDRPGIEAVVKKQGRIAAAESRLALVEEADVKEMVLEEVRVSEVAEERKEEVWERQVERRMLRTGAEGEDVRAMQEALESLGFYSGEEDTEYSYFSSGTERAVKTWQATLGTPEDGIMTSELLEKLFMEQRMKGSSLNVGENGAAVASVTEVAEIQQTVVKETGDLEVEVSQNRVFLLGENRWEEPSRLLQKNKPISRSNASATKCLTCRGEGRLMCTECDGSGEPNIEPQFLQFLEWVDEGTKCPYCEGLGYTICDVCEGRKTTIEN
ncbi:protein disulfide isomerase pTAC5, chloroplastic isoform X1 [Typha latifolia]|uniref:protein disulfide isomerase pTAC5, chloroplastic isoform X1 n=1 Tax=Typha latifolia TaxID=4733 RepID=UPI003C2FC7C8